MIEMLQLKTQEQTFERASHVAAQRKEKVLVLRIDAGKRIPVYAITAAGDVEEMRPETLRVSFFERMGFQLEQLITVGNWRHQHQRERHVAALANFGVLVEGLELLKKQGIYKGE
jgi:hypothetical protein